MTKKPLTAEELFDPTSERNKKMLADWNVTHPGTSMEKFMADKKASVERWGGVETYLAIVNGPIDPFPNAGRCGI